MDIRTRLLELPEEYSKAVTGLIGATAERSRLAIQKEKRRIDLLAVLAEGWKAKVTAGNAESRKAEADGAMAGDPQYRDLADCEREAEERIMVRTKHIEVLTFEFGCLRAVVDLGKAE